MIYKNEFHEDREPYKNSTLPHIEKNITNPTLIEIDRLYGEADILSLKNAKIHHNKIRNISTIAPLIVFFFLLYEAAEQHWLIFVVSILVILLYYIYRHPDDNDTHEKFLEYRVLAETVRIQYFLSKAGIEKKVTDILPWFTEIRIPLIKSALSELSTLKTDEKESILDCWIRNQMEYHDSAHKRALKKLKKNEFYEKISLYTTLIFYGIALIFEISMMIYSPFDLETAHIIRACLKIGVGTATAITIFLSNYYGKMSLSSKVEEHLRMYWLYQNIEREIKFKKEENEELILYLAEQCLIENAIWYSHQKRNKPDFALE